MVYREMKDGLGAGDSQSCNDAVLIVCSASVYPVSGVRCAGCQLYTVYSVHGVNS